MQLGLPEAQLPLAQAAVLIATAPKSNSVSAGIMAAWSDVKAGRSGDVPRELQNVHADSAGMEREQGYKYPHNYGHHWVRQQYLRTPSKMPTTTITATIKRSKPPRVIGKRSRGRSEVRDYRCALVIGGGVDPAVQNAVGDLIDGGLRLRRFRQDFDDLPI